MTRDRRPRDDTGDEATHRVPPDFEYVPTPPTVIAEPVSPEVAAERRSRALAALDYLARDRPGGQPRRTDDPPSTTQEDPTPR